jgi:hypothetical protein
MMTQIPCLPHLSWLFQKSLPIVLLLFLMNGCGPQGQNLRFIHPAQQIETQPTESQDFSLGSKPISKFQRTRPGLPKQCLMEFRKPEYFCLICDESGADIERCYSFQGTLDPVKNCVYSAENIKCVYANPPFALKLDLRGSLEKTLVENTGFWQEGLLSLAKVHLDAIDQKQMDQALAWTVHLAEVLVKTRKNQAWIEQEWGTFLKPAKDPEALKELIAVLQKDKEEGSLTLLKLIKTSRSILEATGTSSKVLNYWEALSLEGLEDPN